MAQPTITSFFVNRKRPIGKDHKSRSKVMILSNEPGYVQATENNNSPNPTLKISTIAVFKNENCEALGSKQVGSISAKSKSTKKTPARKPSKAKGANQPDMVRFLNPKAPATEVTDDQVSDNGLLPVEDSIPKPDDESKSTEDTTTFHASPPNVVFEMKGFLSPRKNASDTSNSPVTVEKSAETEHLKPKPSSHGARDITVEKARKELSLGDIKSRINRSSRLAELRASMARLEQGQERLKQIQDSKRKLFESEESSTRSASQAETETKPQLNQFNSIHLEVPASPSKSPMKSPFKSPLKGSAGPSSPAFKRYSSLIVPGTPSLPLPYNYRHLAELFRCVDTVSSLLFHRKELITFPKLQPAVQEMSRKTFTLQHFAQFLTVYPESYSVKLEKLHRFGSPSKGDKYTLVLTPNFPEESGHGANPNNSMAPSVLLERRRHLFSKLLDIVKKHHEDFLESLDPPMVIPQNKLTRWHPEFVVDDVPDIVPAPLPKPPTQDKCSSAKDVLEKARELYSCNARMEKALETVAQKSSDSANQGRDVNVQIVDAQPASPAPPSSPLKNLQLSSALKGIPKALLEKVRARQAAKALIAMTRTPAQDKEATQYSRLPDIAKILRNIFVAERKGTLPLDLVLEKVGNSYRSSLTHKELEEHFRLLAKAVPGWLSFEHLLKTDFVKLSKGGDMNRVITRLKLLAEEKTGTRS